MIDKEKLRDIQRKIAKQVRVIDKLEIGKIRTIAGFDVAYSDDKLVCGGVVCDFESMEIKEKKYSVKKLEMIYQPGYLAFREGPIIIDTYLKLKEKPDVLLVEGHGVSHPRKCGLASYVGVTLDVISIGVAKNIFVGELVNDRLYINGEIRGVALKTKEKTKSIYVSVGNNIVLSSAVDVVKKCLREHKLPEPLHLAHKYANKIKREEKS